MGRCSGPGGDHRALADIDTLGAVTARVLARSGDTRGLRVRVP